MSAALTSDIWLWILGALLTINLTVLGIIGRFIKQTYDIATDLDILMNGNSGEARGFVQRTEETHRQLADDQQEIAQTLAAQGRLVNEMAFALRDVAEAVDEMNGHDIDTQRIDHLRKRYEDETYETDGGSEVQSETDDD